MIISASEIIRRSIALYRDNWHLCLTYMGIMAVPYILSSFIEVYMLPDNLEQSIAESYSGGSVWLVLAAIVLGIAELWISLAFTRGLAARYLNNQPLGAKAELSSGLATMPAAILVVILTVLAILSGVILLVIPGIIFSIWFAFSTHAVILDNKKGTQALSYSKQLVRGRWGAVLWRLLAPALAFMAVLLVLQAFIGMIYGSVLVNTLLGQGNSMSGTIQFNLIGLNILAAIISLVFLPLFTAAPTILYLELKRTPLFTPPAEAAQA